MVPDTFFTPEPVGADIQHLVDRVLAEQGAYAPVELLIVEGRLRYEDYEAWRCGEPKYLEDVLLGNPSRILKRLEQAAEYARRRKLRAEPGEYLGWGTGAGGGALRFSRDQARESLMRTHYRPGQDRPQLDLFMDTAGTVLVNRIADALVDQRGEQVDGLIARLCEQEPGHRQLGALERLRELQRRVESEQTDAATVLAELRDSITPLARETLGERAQGFLVPLWRRLAELLAGRPFDPNDPDIHRSYVAAMGLDWGGARRAVEEEPGWASHAVLHHRRAIACAHLPDRAQALHAWLQFFWSFPDQAARAADAGDLSDPRLRRAWVEFSDLEPSLDPEDFPSWCLLSNRGLAETVSGRLAPADTRAGAAFGLLCALLLRAGAKATDAEALGLRKRLQRTHGELFEHFIKHGAAR